MSDEYDDDEGFMEPEYDDDEEDTDDDFDIGGDDSGVSTEEVSKFNMIIETYNAYFPKYPIVSEYPGKMTLSIPSDFMPLGQKVVYGFSSSEILLTFNIELNNFQWNTKPTVTFQHPVFQQHFVGRPLVVDLIEKFFSPNYKPKRVYKSTSFLLHAEGQADPHSMDILKKAGFDEQKSHTALVLCHGNIDAALAFLKTGQMPDLTMEMPVSFPECPILYFVMELCDIFLGLIDHCCVCGAKLKEPSVKPSICDKQLCNLSFTNLGVGTSLLQELRRDPQVADLMISCFATALGTQFLNPAPPGFNHKELKKIIEKLPRVDEMISAADDKALSKQLGEDATKLLNWILLSNQSQLISLPHELRLKQFPTRHQFLTLISNVEKEAAFKKLKAKYGSFFLWHGSSGDRWHSIIRNGLKCATGTPLQQNGTFFGAGIYLAPDLAKSRNYARPEKNGYPKSSLGQNLQAVSLCEVAKVPDLKNHKISFTTSNEDAVIVRFLFLSAYFDYDVVKNPPEHIPKLRDILNYHATHNKDRSYV